MAGFWNLVDMKACALPEKVATGFSQLTEEMKGAEYVPVLYCATQIVHGTNHMIICKQTLITVNPQEHLVQFVINEPLPNENKLWTIVSIDPII